MYYIRVPYFRKLPKKPDEAKVSSDRSVGKVGVVTKVIITPKESTRKKESFAVRLSHLACFCLKGF